MKSLTLYPQSSKICRDVPFIEGESPYTINCLVSASDQAIKNLLLVMEALDGRESGGIECGLARASLVTSRLGQMAACVLADAAIAVLVAGKYIRSLQRKSRVIASKSRR